MVKLAAMAKFAMAMPSAARGNFADVGEYVTDAL
jgi:hypothetical protein